VIVTGSNQPCHQIEIEVVSVLRMDPDGLADTATVTGTTDAEDIINQVEDITDIDDLLEKKVEIVEKRIEKWVEKKIEELEKRSATSATIAAARARTLTEVFGDDANVLNPGAANLDANRKALNGELLRVRTQYR
jgi:hypothetical protein